MRFRNVFMFAGSAVVLAVLFGTDPDRGISTGMMLLSLVTPVLAVAFAHAARKALMDYREADMQELFRKAAQSSTGSGLALVAIAIIVSALLGLFGRAAHAQDVTRYVPPAALPYLPVLQAEQRANWPEHPRPALLGALVEHESCLSLTHSRCWNPRAQLKTAREEGAGLGQITRAFEADGSVRFDALDDMRSRYPALRALSWANVYQRPDLQLRALVLMSRENWLALRAVDQAEARLAFADAAYNGGLGGVQRERRACQVKTACDPGQWFGHVELVCLKSRAALYGGRSACDINRHHVQDVLRVRAAKYVVYL